MNGSRMMDHWILKWCPSGWGTTALMLYLSWLVNKLMKCLWRRKKGLYFWTSGSLSSWRPKFYSTISAKKKDWCAENVQSRTKFWEWWFSWWELKMSPECLNWHSGIQTPRSSPCRRRYPFINYHVPVDHNKDNDLAEVVDGREGLVKPEVTPTPPEILEDF